MAAHYPERSEAFAATSDLHFHKVMQDAKGYGKACADYERSVAHGDPKLLDRMANELLTFFGSDAACMKLAEKYARESAQQGRQASYFVTYAEILYRNGKKKQALEAARKALELSKSGGVPSEQEVMQLISRLES
jgi:tetratricopeptide (TPR) repeat protein